MKPLLFTDDFSRSRFRPAFLGRWLKALLQKQILEAVRSGETLVSYADLEDPARARGINFIAYGSTMLQGVTDASPAELIPFLDFLRPTLSAPYRFRSRDGICASDLLCFRHFPSFLHEYLLKPAWALGHLLDRLAPSKVVVTAALSPIENLAAMVACNRGIALETRKVSFLMRLASWAKARISGRFGVGSFKRIESEWGADYHFSPPIPASYDVLLVCDEERRLNRAVELASRLKEEGQTSLIVTVPFKSEAVRRARVIREAGVPIMFVSDFLSAKERGEIGALAIPDARSAWNALDQDPRTRTFAFEGVPIWKSYASMLHSAWEGLNLHAAFTLRATDNCLDSVKSLRVVLFGNGLTTNSFREVARARNLKVVWYCDNPILANVRFWPEILPRYFTVDAVIATSAFLEDSLLRRYGLPKERVFLLGETPVEKGSAPAPQFRIEGTGKPRVLALSAYVAIDVSARRRRQFHELVAEATKAAGYELVVRAHPNENLEGLKADLEEWGIEAVFVSQRENIQDVLSQVNVACMIFTQAGLEVLRGERPLVAVQSTLESGAYESFIPYVGSGAAVSVNADSESSEMVAEKLRVCVEAPAEQLERGRRFFSFYSTANLDTAELRRFSNYLKG